VAYAAGSCFRSVETAFATLAADALSNERPLGELETLERDTAALTA
jgi:hypothetical protein